MTKSHPKFMLTTFGCQMNQADSQRLRGLLARIGYSETENDEEADLILFNTCCVRQHAEQRLIGRIQSLTNHKKRNPHLIIGVSGCMAQNMQAKMLDTLPLVDLVFGPNDIEELPLLLQRAANGKTLGSFIGKGAFDGDFADGIILQRPFSAMVNIIRGCTNFCSYCIVPYVRGPEVSRVLAELKEYISGLAARGVSEITLLGQNVNAYGRDINLEEGFTQLLETIEEIDGIKWVRFMTSHPRDFSLRAIKRIAKLGKVCEQYHLPVQSGSNHVLELMKRGYTRENYLTLIDAVREHVADACLSTDIICGFPGETERDFADTLDLVKKVRYEAAFMYYYSPRGGTEAEKMPNQLSQDEKKSRLARLIEVQNAISLEESQKLVGNNYEVLVDSTAARDDSHLVGKTRSGRSVNFPGDTGLIGNYVRVHIEQARTWTLSGKMITAEKGE